MLSTVHNSCWDARTSPQPAVTYNLAAVGGEQALLFRQAELVPNLAPHHQHTLQLHVTSVANLVRQQVVGRGLLLLLLGGRAVASIPRSSLTPYQTLSGYISTYRAAKKYWMPSLSCPKAEGMACKYPLPLPTPACWACEASSRLGWSIDSMSRARLRRSATRPSWGAAAESTWVR